MPTKQLAPNEPSASAGHFFDAVVDLASNLYGRWLDEKEYEEIDSYQAPFENAASEFGVEIIKMTKRPFGFHFSVDGRVYTLFVKNNAVGYKRIK